MATSPAHCMGFGRVANATQLGQPLNFAAAVHLESDESLERQCVFAEVLAGDNKLQPGQVRVTLEGGPDGYDRTVRVTTSTVIDEPVVTVSVTLGCASKVVRRFVAFIDPPGINLAQSDATEPALQAPQRVDSQLAPLVAIVQGDAYRRPTPAANAPVASRASRRVADAGATATAGSRAVSRSPADAGTRRVATARRPAPSHQAAATARTAAPGARLQLEAPVPVVAQAASAPSVAAAVVPPVPVPAPDAASAPADETVELLARERERIKSLEDGMTQLRADSASTQKTLAAMQLKLKEAESERYANPLVYALSWLCALLAIAVAALLWRQSRGRGAAQWWTAPAAGESGTDVATRQALEDITPPGEGTASGLPAAALRPDPITSVDVSLPGILPTASYWTPTVAQAPAEVPALPTPVPVEPSRELSVEELIDLEQQAEFFIVLGQDEAAIELLMSHVRSDGGASPLPYLKLLEIYRRRGDDDAYERIRERFNRRFNAYAPDWDSDLQQGRTLEDYPEIIERLQTLWVTPSRAMETLDASVFRRNKSDATFDLPAYRELLFLYSIARDRAEHGATETHGAVDLLLPLEPGGADDPIAHLTATGGRQLDFVNSDLVTLPLDLDVSFAEPPAPSGRKSPSSRSSGATPKASPVPSSSSANPSASPPASSYPEGTETVPSALRRPAGFAGESAFVDFELEPASPRPPDKPL